MGDSKNTFETARFYGTEWDELLTLEDPDDVIAEHAERGEPFTVVGYAIEQPPTAYYEALAKRLAEDACESWHDRFGDPEDSPSWTGDPEARLAERLQSVLTDEFAGQQPWHCRPVGQRTYSAVEVNAILDGAADD